jgi:outer membrane protein assembly factor BamC
MLKLRTAVVLILLAGVSSCQYVPSLDEVLPDRRKEYREARSLPDLEIPPDLTADSINDSMKIPGEEPAPTTLSAYEQTRTRGSAPAGAGALPDERAVMVAGDHQTLWPRLREYWQEQGYSLNLDDAELGVLETGWSEPREEAGLVVRERFKVFAEPAPQPGNTLLVINNQRQRQVAVGEGEGEWLDEPGSVPREQQVVAELSRKLQGTPLAGGVSPVSGGASAAALSAALPAEVNTRPRAELVNTENGKSYLALPEVFDEAWRLTEAALIRAGVHIESREPEKGLYHIIYNVPEEEREKKGFLSKLKFWDDDDAEGREYQISLTGVGDKTELVVLNKEGDWETGHDASRILALIQQQYNSK